MGKYLLKRVLHGLFSLVVVVALVMTLVYVLMDRNLIFAQDALYTKKNNNTKVVYKYQRWEDYGYLDYVNFSDYMQDLVTRGEVDDETRVSALKLGRTADKDNKDTKKYAAMFQEFYESKGYTVTRLDAVIIGKRITDGGNPQLFAYRDEPLINRLVDYFGDLLEVDNIHNAASVEGKRGLTFTLHDPLDNGAFSPAIIGNGTTHKYLLYFDHEFPYVHQNIITIHLGLSYSVSRGNDVYQTMTVSQGRYVPSMITYPTGLEELSADNLHTATYIQGSKDGLITNRDRFVDDYTNVITHKNGMSRIGYSFVIGIIASALAYLIGIPLGVAMARHKDGLVDKLGTIYIIFIIAVPSLAYIFLFKAIGGKLGLPTTFSLENNSAKYYILPIVSLALPSIGSLMRWLRRYMIDQMNSDYVKFARSGGLTEQEIFQKHILKNAIVPLVHGIPATVLSALTGAIITERVYVVPGTGNLLTTAINAYDNGVIVGVALFYAVLSIISVILGDLLMAAVDPRISFTSKDR